MAIWSAENRTKGNSIDLGKRFGFAGVYTRKNYISLEVDLDYKLDNPGLSKVEQASANRFQNTICLSDEKDIDEELLSGLKEAYALKASHHGDYAGSSTSFRFAVAKDE